ncbi:phage tail assembly chaperone family protein, TAC [Acinetobacter bereziniae]|uniref:phage tail assembly chaperone family protein, TAC n=1 Tax=Acinetobacter bereziniae TaxID=106648 RepID=UPI0020909286|nr:phage tail assembly chaperone family protein, TAC [Acinetobacter bereziniae]
MEAHFFGETMKKLSISQIKKGECRGAPELATIEFKLHGEDTSVDFYILPFGYSTSVAQMQAFGEKKEALAGMLASVICDEEGNLIFSEDDVRKLFNDTLTDATWNKVVEINVLGKKSNSPKKTNSSSKSDSRSASRTQKSKSLNTEKSKDIQPTSENTEVSTSDDDSNKN